MILTSFFRKTCTHFYIRNGIFCLAFLPKNEALWIEILQACLVYFGKAQTIASLQDLAPPLRVSFTELSLPHNEQSPQA